MISCERECEPSPQNNYGKKKLSRFTITHHKPLFPRELGGLLVFFRDCALGKGGGQTAHDGGDGKGDDQFAIAIEGTTDRAIIVIGLPSHTH